MARMTRRKALTILVAGAAADSCLAVSGASGTPDGRPAQLMDTMERFRKAIPPAQTLSEQNGLIFKEIAPFTAPHLDGVARRLGVNTPAECMVLLTYLRDPDGKIRFIAIKALESLLKAYPTGLSMQCVTEPRSACHRSMTLRFVDRVAGLSA